MTFLESWDQTGSETQTSHAIIIKNLTLYGPMLTRPFSAVDLHGVRLQNGLDFWIIRAKVTINHVRHSRKIIFGTGDLSWPDLDTYLVCHIFGTGDLSWSDLDTYLVCHTCSKGIFTNPLRLLWLSYEQKLSIYCRPWASSYRNVKIWPLTWP